MDAAFQKSWFSMAALEPDLGRSRIAKKIGDLARQSGLFLYHFEYRRELSLPEDWLPPLAQDQSETPVWQAGTLQEHKYASFRNDLALGSYHPGHRGKWTTHELCHGLVGFAWRPDGTTFFNALAARLSELLPVAVYYFLDEAGLRRCPRHMQGSPLFSRYCSACEAQAHGGPGPWDERAEQLVRDCQAFVEREIEATHRSVKRGRIVHHTWANLDLASDGWQYAVNHQNRLASETFARYVDLFWSNQDGCFRDLDALIARIQGLLRHFCGDRSYDIQVFDPWLRVAQDLGWRLLVIREETEGDVTAELDRLIESLAKDCNRKVVEDLIQDYESLHEEWVLPEPQEVFAVGYPLVGRYGLDLQQIAEGCRSACPNSCEALGFDGNPDLSTSAQVFSIWDLKHPSRRGVGLRFSDWISQTHSTLASCAAFEANMTHAPVCDPMDASSDFVPMGAEWSTPQGLQLHRLNRDERQILGLDEPEVVPDADGNVWYAVYREADGQVALNLLEPQVGELLAKVQRGEADVEDLGLARQALIQARLLVPRGYSLTKP